MVQVVVICLVDEILVQNQGKLSLFHNNNFFKIILNKFRYGGGGPNGYSGGYGGGGPGGPANGGSGGGFGPGPSSAGYGNNGGGGGGNYGNVPLSGGFNEGRGNYGGNPGVVIAEMLKVDTEDHMEVGQEVDPVAMAVEEAMIKVMVPHHYHKEVLEAVVEEGKFNLSFPFFLCVLMRNFKYLLKEKIYIYL